MAYSSVSGEKNGIDHDDFRKQSTDFVQWFSSRPGSRLNPKIQLTDLRSTGAGRGVIALDTLEEDEELFSIPKSLVLTTSTSDLPSSILEPLKDAGQWEPLIITVIYEYLRGESSAWYPYFQVLPTRFDSLMFWNSQELAELQASAVVSKIGKEDAETSWKNSIVPVMLRHPELFPIHGDETEKSEKLIRLAHMAGSLIMAYAFDIDADDQSRDMPGEEDFEEDDEDEPMKGMVPFADMLNADADRNNARLFQEDDCLIMKTIKPVQKGEEVFNDYGPLPRSDLLRMYGYITDNYAQYDVVEIPYTTIETLALINNAPDKVVKARQVALDDLILEDGYSITRPTSKLEEAIPDELRQLIRALCLDEDTITPPKHRKLDSFTSKEVALLAEVFAMRLSNYSSTALQDLTILNSLSSNVDADIPAGVLSHRYRMAVEVRRAEKEILEKLLSLCQDYVRENNTADSINKSTKRKHDANSSLSSMEESRRKQKRN